MAVQLQSANLAFKGNTDTSETTSSSKIEDVGSKIDRGVDQFTQGVESVGTGVEKATSSVVKTATGVAGAIALLKGKFAPVVNWFFKEVKENPDKPGEFIRNNLNKTKVGIVGGIAAAAAAGIAIYKGVKSHNAKKAEQAEAQAQAGVKLDVTSTDEDK